MKISINREFLTRHLFALAVFAGFGLWFAYDGFVGYPATPAREIYVSVEQSEPPEGTDVEEFKANKIRIQRILAGLLLLVAAGVGAHLGAVAAAAFEWDDEGFVWRGSRFSYGDIERVDTSAWEAKRILTLGLRGGLSVRLDAWHHAGVKTFFEKVSKRG